MNEQKWDIILNWDRDFEENHLDIVQRKNRNRGIKYGIFLALLMCIYICWIYDVSNAHRNLFEKIIPAFIVKNGWNLLKQEKEMAKAQAANANFVQSFDYDIDAADYLDLGQLSWTNGGQRAHKIDVSNLRPALDEVA